MADESGSGRSSILDRVRKGDDRSDADKLLYRDPEEPPSLYRQWTWREAFDNPLEFLRSFAMRAGDKPTKENVEEQMATGGPIGVNAPGSFGAVLRPWGGSPARIANSEDLLRLARKFYPDVTNALDKLPDIAVERDMRLGRNVLGEYRPISAVASAPSVKTFDLTPGGMLAMGHGNKLPFDELETFAHEGEHARALHVNPPKAAGNLVPNLTNAEVEEALKDYIASGDLTIGTINNYALTNPIHGLRHALIEGEARRTMREMWPQGLPIYASQPELEAAIDKHKSSRALLPTNPLSSRWLK